MVLSQVLSLHVASLDTGQPEDESSTILWAQKKFSPGLAPFYRTQLGHYMSHHGTCRHCSPCSNQVRPCSFYPQYAIWEWLEGKISAHWGPKQRDVLRNGQDLVPELSAHTVRHQGTLQVL